MVRVQVLGGVLLSEPSLANWAHRPTGRYRCRKPEIRVRFPVSPLKNMVLWPSGEGSSLTRRRSVVRVHPGLLDAQIRHRLSGSARAPTRSVGRRVIAGSIPALGTGENQQRLGRQLADHLGSGTDRRLVAGMLWVRLPPEPLKSRGSRVQSREPKQTRRSCVSFFWLWTLDS